MPIDYVTAHGAGPLCVVAFASNGPHFEWKRTLDSLGVPYILIRDSAERWYEDGVRGIGYTVAVMNWLREQLKPYQRKVFIGLSSGAYGALLFGQIVPATEIIAISPLTMLGPDAVPYFPEKYAQRLGLTPTLKTGLDLRSLYLGGPGAKVRAYVSDGDGAELDESMCMLLNIVPTMLRGHSHSGLAKHMRDSGLIKNLILGSQ